jgi:hypothetical protein
MLGRGMQPVVYSRRLARERGIGSARMSVCLSVCLSGRQCPWLCFRWSHLTSMFCRFDRLLTYTRPADARSWHRAGHSIAYTRGREPIPGRAGATFSALSWAIEFPFDDDAVYFAYTYPYTFTDLQSDLAAIARDPARAAVCRQRTVCTTLAGNACPLLTITNFDDTADIDRRKVRGAAQSERNKGSDRPLL